MVINFMDKAILGIVAVPLMQELNIHPSEFGMIASSFFLFFSISAIIFGFIANKTSTKWVLIVLAMIWGISQIPLAFVATVPLLYFSRILLGIGEGPAYPLALHACYSWFKDEKRNLPSSIIFQGVTVGLLISGPILTYIMLNHSWHAAFATLGIASVVWMILWFVFGGEGPYVAKNAVQSTSQSLAKIAYRKIIFDKTYLSNMMLYWVSYWIFAIMFTWIPSYLSKVMGYGSKEAGWMFMLFTGINIPLVFIGSWLSQKLLQRKVSSLIARGWVSCTFVLAGGLSILAAIFLVNDPMTKVILLALGFNLPQLTFVLSSTIVAEIVPVTQRSSAMSINSALATTGGLLAPALTGRLIQNALSPSQGYDHAFIVSAILAIVVGGIGYFAIRPDSSKKRFEQLSSQGTLAVAH
ncbi:MFS transporter [Diaphorobacter caeni]|uniref:MFS transporter n=1 Tax=Diaphorobacter caeni TaxID=2784387 RepID=UPI002264A282|nr:MFS transporter [Diaphorobacter caeni]